MLCPPQLERYKNSLITLKMSLTYFHRMKDFFKYLDAQGKSFEEVNDDIIYAYLSSKNFSINSINTFIKAGKHFSIFIYTSAGINPFKNFKLLRVERKIPTYIMEKELVHGINYTISSIGEVNPYKVQAALYFLFYTGLRKSELLNLKRKDISLDTDPICITVRTPTKYNKERITCFPVKYKRILDNYFNSDPEVSNAFNMERWHLEYMVKIFGRAFPGKKISIHTFRHSFAKYLISNRVDVTVVSKLLGHSNIETTLIYVNPDENMIKSIYKDIIK